MSVKFMTPGSRSWSSYGVTTETQLLILSRPHTLDPQSAQYLLRRRMTASHTAQRRTQIAHTVRPGRSMRSATMMAIAVPVRYSDRICSARGSTPSSRSHAKSVPVLARVSTATTTPATSIFRSPIDITYLAFRKKDITSSRSAQVKSRRKQNRLPSVQARVVSASAEVGMAALLDVLWAHALRGVGSYAVS